AIVTSPVYQSPLFGPVTTGTMDGGVVSRLIVTRALDVPPRLVAVHVNTVPAVSSVTVVLSQPLLEVSGDSSGSTLQLTVTSPAYQPSGCCKAPTMSCAIAGGAANPRHASA